MENVLFKILKALKLRRLRGQASALERTLDHMYSQYSQQGHCCPSCATGGVYDQLVAQESELRAQIKEVETSNYEPLKDHWAFCVSDQEREILLSALDRLEHGSGLSNKAEELRELLMVGRRCSCSKKHELDTVGLCSWCGGVGLS